MTIRRRFTRLYKQISFSSRSFIFLVVSAILLLCIPGHPLADDIKISNNPLEATFKTPPPAVMFILDDSWSMDSEVLTPEKDGYFNGKALIFRDGHADEANRLYSSYLASFEDLKHWKSQWYGHNKLYYNPEIDYKPWPNYTPTEGPHTYVFDDANTSTPRYDPRREGKTITLNGNFFNTEIDAITTETTEDGSGTEAGSETDGDDDSSEDSEVNINITVRNSHYFLFDETTERIFLVNLLPDIRKYYELKYERKDYSEAETGGEEENEEDVKQYYPNTIEEGEFREIDYALLPESLKNILGEKTDAQDLQNFANWFQYYRKRYLTSIAAVAQTVTNLSQVYVGFHSINETANEAVMAIDVTTISNDGIETKEDHKGDFLEHLYTELGFHNSRVNTFLREALVDVGDYFKGVSHTGLGSYTFGDLNVGGPCQKTYAILMTDGYWSEQAFSGFGDVDNDKHSDTLADVAAYYYNEDLSDQENLVATSDCDQNTEQHLVTFAVSFGVTGSKTLDPEDYNFCNLTHKETGEPPAWGSPFCKETTCEIPEKVDDLWHAAANSKGKFFNADPENLAKALKKIFESIADYNAPTAAITVANDTFYESGTYYQCKYASKTWTGSVSAVQIHYNASNTYDPITIGKTLWVVSDATDADAENKKFPSYDQRKIITYSIDDSDEENVTGQTIPFKWESLNNNQKVDILGIEKSEWDPLSDIEKEALLNGAEADGLERISCLRGKVPEGSYRQVPMLGDIVHSSPVPVNGVVYVGANDGKLHAFNGDSGKEIFAYVPNLVFSDLKYLLETDFQHHYYVDQTPVWTRIPQQETQDKERNEYYLVGGLNAGGKGYYCLNITKINKNSTPDLTGGNGIVQWEFTDDDDMGLSFSSPVIVRTQAKTQNGDPLYVVIFGNGYNSANGHAVLFVVDLSSGDILKKFDTEKGNPEDKNGMSSPIAIDVDNDKCVEYVYAGDIKGNLWKFDLSGDSVDDWDFSFRVSETNPVPQPLFTTLPNQPITSRPDVMFHCCKSGYMVCFGTGQFLNEDDKITSFQQAIYGIWDFGDKTDPGEYLGTIRYDTLGNYYDIVEQDSDIRVWFPDDIGTVDYTDDIALITSIESTSSPYIDWASKGDNTSDWATSWSGEDKNEDPAHHVGWMIPFQNAGERVIKDVRIDYDMLTVFSIIPKDQYCTNGNTTIEYSLNPCNGTNVEDPIVHPEQPLPPIEVNGEIIFDDTNDKNDTEDNPVRVIKYKKLFFWNETGS